MLGEERETERLQTERGQKIARYTEIIGLCALELPKERSKPVHNTLVDTIFTLWQWKCRENQMKILFKGGEIVEIQGMVSKAIRGILAAALLA